MEKKELICIGCPMGCPLTVEMEGGAVLQVKGNTCPRGDAYGRKEVTNPTRIVTSTVRVTGGTLPMVSAPTCPRARSSTWPAPSRTSPSARRSASARCWLKTWPAQGWTSSPPKTWVWETEV